MKTKTKNAERSVRFQRFRPKLTTTILSAIDSGFLLQGAPQTTFAPP